MVLTHEHFAPLLDGTFAIVLDDSRLEVVLTQVDPLGERRRRPGGREPFSLVFRGPHQPVLPQRTYVVEHAVAGRIEMFLVPIGPDDAGMRYEAIFN